ncbi:MAG TPA: bifunctional glutamate N-acetyltransferase/amino-acid acetyltransferase ArgJ [Acidobacteriaceae bacterium]|jgi:glutamate N-acetyltransferase/amino-acid N-acetyltransferase
MPQQSIGPKHDLDKLLYVTDAASPAVSSALPRGFRWSSVKAGIKASGKPDVALAACDTNAAAAAMFTSNQLVAAPIIVGRHHLAATGSKVKAVLVNAGNANCATGPSGIDACHRSCVAVADQFGCVFDEILPSSTGIIGVPLPIEKLLTAIPAVKAGLGDTPEHAEAFATAILTTDTKLKVAQASFTVEGKTVNLFGCAKGAGMIGPQLVPHATMLVYLFTDLAAGSEHLQALLAAAVNPSFNCISIDGDTSTNDTVLLLASGASGVAAQDEALTQFEAALRKVCDTLAWKIVDDGEGVTHVVTLEISGAGSDAAAQTIARSIANSPLVKTAWSSGDPNWGRLLAAAGKAGVFFDPAKTTVFIDGLPVFDHGTRSAAFDEAATHTAMEKREYTIAMDFGGGPGHARYLTCDLTHEYVSINADYST